MRSVLLAIALAACGGRVAPTALPIATPSTQPTPTPAHDLAAGKPASATPASANAQERDPRVIDLDTIRIRAVSRGVGGEPEVTAVATMDLFHQATDAAKAGHTDEALGLYRQLVHEFPDSLYAPLSMFDIAAIYDGRGDVPATIAALHDLIRAYPQAHESIEGHLFIAALQADHQQYADAHATLTEVLARANLTWADRVEAFARDGYVQLELGAFDAADASLQQAVAAWRNAPRIDDPYYIAMAQYYRGELAHRRFIAQPLRTPDDQMYKDLDAKRALAVEAYDRWKESLGFKQAYWATAAGYQMSQVFVELWQATVTAPYPHEMDERARAQYVTEVHHRVHADLAKALEGHRMNIELAKAFGVDTTWSAASQRQAVEIADKLAADSDGHYVLPE